MSRRERAPLHEGEGGVCVGESAHLCTKARAAGNAASPYCGGGGGRERVIFGVVAAAAGRGCVGCFMCSNGGARSAGCTRWQGQ